MMECSPAVTLLDLCWRFPAGPVVSRLSDFHQKLGLGERVKIRRQKREKEGALF